MKIERFMVGMIGTNCYLVTNEATKELVIVDPGGTSPQMLSHIRTEGLKPQAILLTHGHYDHIAGIPSILSQYEIPVYALDAEEEVLGSVQANVSADFGRPMTFTDATYFRDGDTLTLAGYRFLTIATPGHTKGGVCYYIEEEGVLFSGDTLFHGSVGRTDFPTGSMSQIVRSIRDRLLILPGDTVVYPGHNDGTTIGEEAMYNPFVR